MMLANMAKWAAIFGGVRAVMKRVVEVAVSSAFLITAIVAPDCRHVDPDGHLADHASIWPMKPERA